jgi:hypothetical protein
LLNDEKITHTAVSDNKLVRKNYFQISSEASRKIVGLNDSDDENEDHKIGPFINKLAKKGGNGKRVKEEDKLTKELKELEQTFKSIEEEERKGWGLSRSSNKSWGKPETHSAFTPSNRQTLENNGSWSASPPSFPRNAPKTSHRSRGGPTPFAPGNASKPTLTKTLKFRFRFHANRSSKIDHFI